MVQIEDFEYQFACLKTIIELKRCQIKVISRTDKPVSIIVVEIFVIERVLLQKMYSLKKMKLPFKPKIEPNSKQWFLVLRHLNEKKKR